MSELIAKVNACKVVVAKCAMLTFISMGTLLVAATQNWTDEYVSTLRWYHWASLIIAALVNGCTTINSFIDKTFYTESMKIAIDAEVRAEQVKMDTKIADIKQEVAEVKADAKVEKENVV